MYVFFFCFWLNRFFKYLRNVSIEGDLNKPNIEFTADGDLKSAELKIMNLRPGANNKNLVWEEVIEILCHFLSISFQFTSIHFNFNFNLKIVSQNCWNLIDWCLEIMGIGKIGYT